MKFKLVSNTSPEFWAFLDAVIIDKPSCIVIMEHRLKWQRWVSMMKVYLLTGEWVNVVCRGDRQGAWWSWQLWRCDEFLRWVEMPGNLSWFGLWVDVFWKSSNWNKILGCLYAYITVVMNSCPRIMGPTPSCVVNIEWRRGPSTEPWGTPLIEVT